METNIAFEEWEEIFWVHELATILGNGEMTKFPGKKEKISKFVNNYLNDVTQFPEMVTYYTSSKQCRKLLD